MLVGLFVDIPKPKCWPPPKVGDEQENDRVQELLAYGYKRDPVGDKIHTWLACLFMFCLPLATAPTSISLALLFVYSLLRLPTIWRTLTPLLQCKVYWALLAWVLYSTFSIAWSSDKSQGLDHAESMWIMAIPIPLLLWPVLRKWKWMIIAGLTGVFLQNLFQLSEIIGSWFLDGQDWISIVKNNFKKDKIPTYFGRPIGLDNHEGNGSLFIATALLVWLGFFIQKKTWGFVICIPALFAFIGLASAQSRAAWFGFVISLILLFCLSVNKQLLSKKASLVIAVAACLLICTASLIKTNHSASFLSRILEIPVATNAYVTDGTVNTGIDERLNWYSTEFTQSFNTPVFQHTIFGHGLGSTTEIDFSLPDQPVAKTTVHPHNAYIQILYEGGVVGLGLFAWLLITMARVVRDQSNNIYRVVGLSAILLWAIAAFFEGGQNSGRVLALLMVLLVVYEFIQRFQEQACTPPTGQP